MLMKRLFVTMLAVLCSAVFVTGCSEEKAPEEPAPEAPRLPTAEELYRELSAAFQPLQGAATGDGVQVEFAAQVANNFKQVVNKVSSGKVANGPNVDQALRRIQEDVETTIRAGRDGERWRVLSGAIPCFLALRPNDAKYNALHDITKKMIEQPQVQLKGFTEIDGEIHAFFEVVDRKTRVRSSHTVREGEEFAEVFQFIRIIGNKQRVEILYKPANKSFERVGPGERVTSGT